MKLYSHDEIPKEDLKPGQLNYRCTNCHEYSLVKIHSSK